MQDKCFTTMPHPLPCPYLFMCTSLSSGLRDLRRMMLLPDAAASCCSLCCHPNICRLVRGKHRRENGDSPVLLVWAHQSVGCGEGRQTRPFDLCLLG